MRRISKKKVSACIPVLSFFTGGGFLDIGFEMAGFYSVWTNEKNRVFAELYAYGMTKWRQSVFAQSLQAKISTVRDIEHLFAPEIIKQAFSRGRPRFFGIIGGASLPGL